MNENTHYSNPFLSIFCPKPDITLQKSRCVSDKQVWLLSFTRLIVLTALLLVTVQILSSLHEAQMIITFKKNQLAYCLGSASCVYFHNPFSFCSTAPPYKSKEDRVVFHHFLDELFLTPVKALRSTLRCVHQRSCMHESLRVSVCM